MNIWDPEFSYFLKFSLTADFIRQGISSVLFWKFDSSSLNKSVTRKTLIFRVNNFFHCLQITESVRMSKWGWCYFHFISFAPPKNKETNRKNVGRDTATAVANYSGPQCVTLTMDKCTSWVPKIKFLGNGVSANGIEMDPDKVAAVVNLHAPKNCHEVCLFLGMVNHLSKFVDYLADKTKPMWDLNMQKDSQWVWGNTPTKSMRRN